jgi:hypothetical protein
MLLVEHKHLIVPLSVVCLALSATLGRFADQGIRWIDFTQGLLLGLALTLSVFSLIVLGVLRGYE